MAVRLPSLLHSAHAICHVGLAGEDARFPGHARISRRAVAGLRRLRRCTAAARVSRPAHHRIDGRAGADGVRAGGRSRHAVRERRADPWRLPCLAGGQRSSRCRRGRVRPVLRASAADGARVVGDCHRRAGGRRQDHGWTYTTKTATTFGVNTESTYDWENEQWTVPVNVFVTQLLKLGPLPISLSLDGRDYAERPIGGPDWGLRFAITFHFPR